MVNVELIGTVKLTRTMTDEKWAEYLKTTGHTEDTIPDVIMEGFRLICKDEMAEEGVSEICFPAIEVNVTRQGDKPE